MKNVFIIGTKGYTKNYGGWETFIHGLIDNWTDKDVSFTIFEISQNKEENGTIKEINGIKCISIYIKQTDSSAMVRFDLNATKYAYNYVLNNKIENPIFFYLGLRIGPYIWLKKRKFKKAGITLIENPAGLEWKRTKWNKLIQLYSYISAKMMASSMDYLVCDNGGILSAYEKFRCCKKVKKTVIAYGANTRRKLEKELPNKVKDFYDKFGVTPNHYFLILGRLVPENNYSLMLSEIIKYKGDNKFLIICNIEKENKYFSKLCKKYPIKTNSNVIFAGELYDCELLSYIRQNAIAYIHGHSVGGTNPGLLEALANTDVNILFDCPFNKEVGKETAIYFDNISNALYDAVCYAEHLSLDKKEKLGKASRLNMLENYSWNKICKSYSDLFKLLV